MSNLISVFLVKPCRIQLKDEKLLEPLCCMLYSWYFCKGVHLTLLKTVSNSKLSCTCRLNLEWEKTVGTWAVHVQFHSSFLGPFWAIQMPWAVQISDLHLGADPIFFSVWKLVSGNIASLTHTTVAWEHRSPHIPDHPWCEKRISVRSWSKRWILTYTFGYFGLCVFWKFLIDVIPCYSTSPW